jgi:toxin ParE1/3/4
MTDYRLSREADRDVFGIARYTAETWSEAQVDQYLLGMHELLSKLAQSPSLGVKCDDIRSGYFRRRYRNHMIFYKKGPHGILVVRILHARADYIRHL